jgi:hypothetical protein
LRIGLGAAREGQRDQTHMGLSIGTDLLRSLPLVLGIRDTTIIDTDEEEPDGLEPTYYARVFLVARRDALALFAGQPELRSRADEVLSREDLPSEVEALRGRLVERDLTPLADTINESLDTAARLAQLEGIAVPDPLDQVLLTQQLVKGWKAASR